MMFDWFKAEHRKRRKKIRLDRKHLEARARNFLKRYLEAEEIQKFQFYRAGRGRRAVRLKIARGGGPGLRPSAGVDGVTGLSSLL